MIVDDPFWIRLCTDPRLIDVIEPFLGPDIALFGAHYISKPPRSGQPVLWHQDGNYWPLEPMEVITIWLAGDDSTPENGCMRVIPGSHRMKRLHEHRRTEDAPNVLSSTLDQDVDEAAAVDVVVPAGGLSLHDPYIIHGSKANRSERRRIGLTLRYIPTTTRILRGGPSGVPVPRQRRRRDQHLPALAPLPSRRPLLVPRLRPAPVGVRNQAGGSLDW